MAKSDIDASDIGRLLRYDPETGDLFWRPRPIEDFPDPAKGRAWNTRWAGKPALNSRHCAGYRTGSVLGVDVLAHRAAWAAVHGVWPEQIDHINGDRSDNRLSNLRAVAPAQNSKNLKKQTNNKSGFTGVSRHPDGKWQARIKVGPAYLHLGLFACLGQAIKARSAANVRFGYHPNHGRS